MGPHEIEAEAVALRKVGPAPVERDRSDLLRAKPQRAGQGVVEVERAVELTEQACLLEDTGRGEVGESDGRRVLGALSVEDVRIVVDMGGERFRQIRKTRVRTVHLPADGALHEVELGQPRQRRWDDPGQLGRHVRCKRAGAADRARSLKELEEGQEVALWQTSHGTTRLPTGAHPSNGG
jgi:hypothetical protein